MVVPMSSRQVENHFLVLKIKSDKSKPTPWRRHDGTASPNELFMYIRSPLSFNLTGGWTLAACCNELLESHWKPYRTLLGYLPIDIGKHEAVRQLRTIPSNLCQRGIHPCWTKPATLSKKTLIKLGCPSQSDLLSRGNGSGYISQWDLSWQRERFIHHNRGCQQTGKASDYSYPRSSWRYHEHLETGKLPGRRRYYSFALPKNWGGNSNVPWISVFIFPLSELWRFKSASVNYRMLPRKTAAAIGFFIENDEPYLAPCPTRGKVNKPAT